jgi:hypothetical protein
MSVQDRRVAAIVPTTMSCFAFDKQTGVISMSTEHVIGLPPLAGMDSAMPNESDVFLGAPMHPSGQEDVGGEYLQLKDKRAAEIQQAILDYRRDFPSH